MIPTIQGTPAIQIGQSAISCEGDNLAVPPVCDECRQQKRWLPRTLGWAQSGFSRFKAIIGAILREHDDILSSLCGFCMVQDAPDCECFIAQYRMLGLPMSIPTNPNASTCLVTSVQRTIPVSCYVACPMDCELDCGPILTPEPDIPTCWLIECAHQPCQTCLTVTLDPCANPLHLQAMTIAHSAASGAYGRLIGGAGLLSTLSILFEGSVPQIVSAQFGEVIVTLGRPMTAFEREYLPFLLSFVPLGLGVELKFATPCPE